MASHANTRRAILTSTVPMTQLIPVPHPAQRHMTSAGSPAVPGTGTMAGMRTIALEEHFWTPELAAPPGTGPLATWGQRVDDQLRDLGQARLTDMDANGIDFQVISHVAPAAQRLAGAAGSAPGRQANH